MCTRGAYNYRIYYAILMCDRWRFSFLYETTLTYNDDDCCYNWPTSSKRFYSSWLRLFMLLPLLLLFFIRMWWRWCFLTKCDSEFFSGQIAVLRSVVIWWNSHYKYFNGKWKNFHTLSLMNKKHEIEKLFNKREEICDGTMLKFSCRSFSVSLIFFGIVRINIWTSTV